MHPHKRDIGSISLHLVHSSALLFLIFTRPFVSCLVPACRLSSPSFARHTQVSWAGYWEAATVQALCIGAFFTSNSVFDITPWYFWFLGLLLFQHIPPQTRNIVADVLVSHPGSPSLLNALCLHVPFQRLDSSRECRFSGLWIILSVIYTNIFCYLIGVEYSESVGNLEGQETRLESRLEVAISRECLRNMATEVVRDRWRCRKERDGHRWRGC